MMCLPQDVFAFIHLFTMSLESKNNKRREIHPVRESKSVLQIFRQSETWLQRL